MQRISPISLCKHGIFYILLCRSGLAQFSCRKTYKICLVSCFFKHLINLVRIQLFYIAVCNYYKFGYFSNQTGFQIIDQLLFQLISNLDLIAVVYYFFNSTLKLLIFILSFPGTFQPYNMHSCLFVSPEHSCSFMNTLFDDNVFLCDLDLTLF